MSARWKPLAAILLGSTLLFPVGAAADTSKCRDAIATGERTDLERFGIEFPDGSMRWRAGSKEAHDAKVEANFRAAAQRTGFDPNRVIVSFSGLLRAFQYAGDTGVLTVNSLAGVSRTSAVSFQVDYPYQEIFLPIRTHQISKPDNVIETEELSIGLLNVKNTGPLWNRSQTLRLNDWRGDGSASGTDSLRYLIVGRFAAPFVMQGERHLARTTTDSIDRRHRGTAMMLDLNCIALYSEATKQILYEQSF